MNKDRFMAKALDGDGKVIEGFYVFANNKSYIVQEDGTAKEVNPYSLCKNTGIKDKNGKYIYEYDLLKCERFSDEFYAYAEWNELTKKYKVRRSFEYSGNSDFERYTIEVCGNVVLFNKDWKIIEKADEEANKKEVVYDTSYCPSCFKK